MIVRKFLAQQDLADGQGGFDEWLVTILKLLLERMRDDSDEQRWVLYFREHRRGLVLGTTVLRFLEKELGENSEDWTNKQVVLYVDPTITYQGRVTGGLRLKRAAPPKPAVVPKAPKAPPVVPAEELGSDDDIP
jgi:hypothetical protein